MVKRTTILLIIQSIGFVIGIFLWVNIVPGYWNIITTDNSTSIIPYENSTQIPNEPSEVNSKQSTIIWNPIGCFQLALLATALGAISLWFAGRREVYSNIYIPGSADSREQRMITGIGKILLMAAVSFGLLGILSPVLSQTIWNSNFADNVIIITMLICVIFGTLFLTLSLIMILISVIFWKV